MKAFPIQYEAGIPLWVRRLTVDFVNWYLENYGVDQQIKIRLCNAGYLDPGDHTLNYGVFFRSKGRLHIYIATRWRDWKQDGYIKTCHEGKWTILDSLAHELCEYEKWRDNKAGNHRGIQNRIDSLIRKFNDA
jgi:hypothetical protein